MMKRIVVLAILGVALVVGVANVSASQASTTFSATIYGDTDYTCDAGAIDTSGATYGTFTATKSQSSRWVTATLTVHNLYPFQVYNVAVAQSGYSCLTNNVYSFYANSKGQAIVQFKFWAHTGETSAWVTLETPLAYDIHRSTSVPIG
jgi:hypothetical protein